MLVKDLLELFDEYQYVRVYDFSDTSLLDVGYKDCSDIIKWNDSIIKSLELDCSDLLISI